MIILLQAFAVICGLCLMVGAIWAYIDTVMMDGFDPIALLMAPLAMMLVAAGGMLVIGGISGF